MRFPQLLILGLSALPVVAQVGIATSAQLGDRRHRLPAGLGVAGACAMADLNGDGLLDIVRAERDVVVVLLQDRTGSFEPDRRQQRLAFPGRGEVTALAVGRLDLDVDLDLVVGMSAGPDAVLHNDGTGVLTEVLPSPLPATTVSTTEALIVANFDGAAADDILALSSKGPARLWFSDQLTGRFVDQTAFLPRPALTAAVGAAFDLDRDGDQDLALGSTAVAAPIVLINDGRGDFRANAIALPVGSLALRRVVAAEVTGDRILDLLLAPAAIGAPGPPIVLRNGAAGFQSVVQAPGGFAAADFLDVAAADVDGDGVDDLVVLQHDGQLLLGRNPGTGAFRAAQDLAPPGPRCCIRVGDLEGDGDPDLFVPGRGLEDALLLGDGAGAFFDTEQPTVPSGAVPRSYELVAVDVTADHDPDLVLYDAAGNGSVLENDGSARFARSNRITLPVLPAGAYRALRVGNVSGSGRDLFVLGQSNPLNPAGLRLVVWRNAGGYADLTGQLWPTLAAQRIHTALAVGAFGPAPAPGAPSDVVLADSNGQVTFHRLESGRYVEKAGAVPTPGPTAILAILTGDVDRDGLLDLVLLSGSSPPAVYLGRTTVGFRQVPGAAPLGFGATSGVLQDVTGDGVPDLLLATPARPSGFSLMAGDGRGGFADVTGTWLANVTQVLRVVDVAVLEAGSELWIVLGRDGDPDLLMRRQIGRFGPLEMLPSRGSRATRGFVAADLDVDGDQDLVSVRAGTEPAVHLAHAVQLTAIGVGQLGRPIRLLAAAEPGETAFLMFSPFATRLPLPPYGVLRLVNPATLGAVAIRPDGFAFVTLSVPAGLPPLSLPLQIATLDLLKGRVRIGNLERLRITHY